MGDSETSVGHVDDAERAVAPRGSSRYWSRLRPRIIGMLLPIGGLAILAIALFFCYLRISDTQPVTSDGASNALQAWDMLHGNVLLSGWTLTDVSFYTTELPEYMIVEAIRGLGAFDVHDAAAATYTLLALLAGLTARGSATGRAGLLRFAIALGIMIAPEFGPGAFILLLSPDHVGTGVPLLLTWLLLDRLPPRRSTAVVVGLLLAWISVGDRLAALVAAVPIAIVCYLRFRRARQRDSELTLARSFEAWLGLSVLCSIPASLVATKVIGLLGGFREDPLSLGVASPTAWWPHLVITAEGILGQYGADFTNRRFGVFVVVALIHVCGLILALAGFYLGYRMLRRGDDLVISAMTVAVALTLAVFVFSDLPQSYWDTREIAPVLPYGAVLAGRLLAPRLRSRSLRPFLVVWPVLYLFALAYAVAQPAQPARHQDLADWLVAHHMTCGLGSYAVANSTTLDSGGRVSVRAPTWTSEAAYQGSYQSLNFWYRPTACTATFVVSTQADGADFAIPAQWVRAAFGAPVRTISWHGYTIWIWNKNLLNDLRPASQHAAPVGGYVQLTT